MMMLKRERRNQTVKTQVCPDIVVIVNVTP